MGIDALWDRFIQEFSHPKPDLIFNLKEKFLKVELPEGSFLHFLAENSAHWQNLVAAVMIGLDLWGLNKQGMTPLMAVANRQNKGWVKTAQTLMRIARLADVDLAEYVKFGEGKGSTFLHLVINGEGASRLIALELEWILEELRGHLTEKEYRGVLEVRDEKGRTPFILAVEVMDWDAAETLLEAGANAKAVDGEGKNALHIIMEQLGDPVEVKIERAWELVRRLIKKEKVSPNARVKEGELAGMTALHVLCKVASEVYFVYGGEEVDIYPELARELLHLGARPNAPLNPVLDEEGREVPLSRLTLSELEEVLEGSPVGITLEHPGVLRTLYEGTGDWSERAWEERGIFLPVHLRKAERKIRRELTIATRRVLGKKEAPRGEIDSGSEELQAWYEELLKLDWTQIKGSLWEILGLLESVALLWEGVWKLSERTESFGLDLSKEDRAELWSFMDRAFPLVEKLKRLKERIAEAKEMA